MTESLTVPTATTFRVLPVGVLEDRRRTFNQALQSAGKPGKISFTHLIAFALVQATKQHPVMERPGDRRKLGVETAVLLRDLRATKIQVEGEHEGLRGRPTMDEREI